MFFSVIIPTYNRLSFLKEAISSVHNQSFKNYELIIVDDASTDETAQYLSSLQNCTVLKNNINKGVSYSRNKGIEQAKGNYIAFLDSDDLWEPTKLEKQAQFFKTQPNTYVCHTNEVWLRNGTHMNQSKHHKKQAGFFIERAVHLCLVSPSSVAIKRDILIEEGMFDTTLPVCEDYDLWLKLNLKYPFGFLDEALVIKQGGHTDQLSQKLPAMDMYRIKSMLNILSDRVLTSEQKQIFVQAIRKKHKILYKGALKHQNQDVIQFCESVEIDTL